MVAATLTVFSSTASAAPGDATITATPNTNLNTVQVIQVSGNAGPLSTRPDTSYPKLHVSMCRLPLTSTSCDTDLTNFGAAVTGNPATDPHVVDVQPDASGNWGPIAFPVRKTLVNGDGRFQCGTGAAQCVIGSANSPRPADHAYDAIQNLNFAAATITQTPLNVVNGDTVTVTGTNFPMQTVAVDDGTPKTQGIAAFQCKIPVTGGGDCDSTNLFPATVDIYGGFTTTMTVQQVVVGNNCSVVQCSVGTIKNPPGAPDAYSVYGTSAFIFPASPNAKVVALNNRGTAQADAPQTGTATATRIGKSVAIQGAGFTPSVAFDSLQLCDVSGLNCTADLTNAAGTVPVAPGVATATGTKTWQGYAGPLASIGVHTVKITQGAIVVTTGSFLIQGTPTIAAPATVVLGQSLTVVGSMFDPGTSGNVPPAADPTVTVAAGTSSVTVSPDANGAFSVTLPMTDPAATQITATASTGAWLLTAAPQAFSYVLLADSCIVPTGGQCQLFQNVTLQVTGGDLSMAKDPGNVVMSGITLNGLNQVSTGNVRQVTVTDARGSSAGWTLNASLSDLTNGGGTNPNSTIAANTFNWAPVCTTTGGSATVSTGAAGTLRNTDQVFCSSASGQGGGQFTADSALNVSVPATQAAGAYTGILTLTLS